MATSTTALTTKVDNGSPYQLSSEQTMKASKALLKHIKSTDSTPKGSKPNLLAGDDDAEDTSAAIWFQLTTKKHITDTKRLKPGKIAVPHALNASPTTTICLITADPQRTYKDIVASPAFPAALGARITRVVGIAKLKAKWTQYEAQRKLYAEHDVFLADDRIVTLLPKLLGKTFYQKTTKRPVPVTLTAPAPRSDGKRIARAKGAAGPLAGSPQQVAAEIEKALAATLVHLSPSTNTAVRVGYASWGAREIAENVEAVAAAMVERWVPKKWRGVKSMHIKGATTAALPIWLADELWVDEADVVDDETAARIREGTVGKKRKGGIEAGDKKEKVKAIEEKGTGEEKSAKKQKLAPSNDDTLDREIALRKERLKKQKDLAALDVEDDVPKPSKKAKKSKA